MAEKRSSHGQLLNEIEQRVKEFFRLNIKSLLEDDTSLDVLSCITDIDSLSDVLGDLQLDDAAKVRLMQRVSDWSGDDAEKCLAASKFYKRLLSAPGRAPARISTSSRQEITFGVYGDSKDGNLETAIISLPSRALLWSGSKVVSARRSVIVDNELYRPDEYKVNVYNLNSNELVREVTVRTDSPVEFVHLFRGKVFISTLYDIFILDDQRVNCTKIAHVDQKLWWRLAILSYDSNVFTIAVSIKDKEMWALTYGGDRTPASGRREMLQTLSDDSGYPIGRHEGLLYLICREDERQDYVAFRNGVEVKRHRIEDNCSVFDYYMWDGILYVVYEVGRGNEKRTDYVCGINLNSDEVFFRKSADELGLKKIHCLIPVCRRAL